ETAMKNRSAKSAGKKAHLRVVRRIDQEALRACFSGQAAVLTPLLALVPDARASMDELMNPRCQDSCRLFFITLRGRATRQGCFEFRRQLDYKLAWKGGWLVTVPPRNTSRTCPACGCVSAENRRTQARFACVACGLEDNADRVGAINILARGHRVAACGEARQSAPSAKQEPTEATAHEATHA
ncbi:protein containing Transposase, IS605 OrfB, partial [mine drainage metagenome]